MVNVKAYISEVGISAEDVKAVLYDMRVCKVLPLEHTWKSFSQRDGTVEKKLHLYVEFVGKTRPIDLRERNVARLSSLFGSEDTEEWSGKTFKIEAVKKGIVEWVEVRA